MDLLLKELNKVNREAYSLAFSPALAGSAAVHIMVLLGPSCQCQVALTQGSGA